MSTQDIYREMTPQEKEENERILRTHNFGPYVTELIRRLDESDDEELDMSLFVRQRYSEQTNILTA
ncbi:MAG: hypothetical protein FWG68_08600 [Defluviitaleaceae bacterium]|nr:hypothetical protein [Defluviitaleaceae bacterium]